MSPEEREQETDRKVAEIRARRRDRAGARRRRPTIETYLREDMDEHQFPQE
jgi:hypothetical protein